MSSKIAAKEMRLAGHCHRHKALPAATLGLRTKTGRIKEGRGPRKRA